MKLSRKAKASPEPPNDRRSLTVRVLRGLQCRGHRTSWPGGDDARGASTLDPHEADAALCPLCPDPWAREPRPTVKFDWSAAPPVGTAVVVRIRPAPPGR